MSARAPRKALSLTTLLALAATPLALGVVPANAAVEHLVISEAYGGGGNSGATLRNDFVEIFNPTDSAITMTNWSLQYRSATGGAVPAASGITAISGTVPAHGYFLVQQGAGTGGTEDLPAPDATGSTAMSGSGFQVWLANTTTPLDPVDGNIYAGTADPAIVDLVGVGSTALSYEGAGRAPGTANATSANRLTPETDTDDNAADFETRAPSPKNSSSVFPEPERPEVLVSEVFSHGEGGGPHGGDFLEIVNTGSATADLSMVSVTESGGTSTVLTGTLAAGEHTVVDALLADDDGSVELTWAHDGATLDLVGWGASPVFEGSAAAPAGSASESIQRNTFSDDTDDNAADFIASEPTRGAVYLPPADPEFTIPEIQGTASASDKVGQDVSVKGIVTASYPDGGMNGFVIQTPGHDPADDATPDASDAIFVYQGSNPSYTPPAIGKHVTIRSGRVTEFSGLTQITVSAGAFVEVRDATPEEEVTPGTVVPGTDCTLAGGTTDCLTGDALADEREKRESEIFLPTAPYTVTDSYDGSPWAGSSSSNFGEIGLAANDESPLVIPVEEANPATETAAYDARVAYNAAKMITLDDGATLSISGSNNTGTPYPWLTKEHTVRVGAAVTFVKPAVLEWRNNAWKLIPQNRVQPGTTGADQVVFEQDQPAAPDAVAGNVKIATFNMLNYFSHVAQDWDNLPDDEAGTNRSCSYYNDRNGNRITARECTWRDLRNDPLSTLPDIGPRGAATEASLLRQEGKEVAAINTMAADVVSLEEVENPVKIGYADRDHALTRLVNALNADWAVRTEQDTVANPRWAFVASPRPQAQPTVAEQDAIRNAFIYNPRVVTTIGASRILTNAPAMRNAREPLAQAFRHVDGTRDDGFIVITNHFKSKGAPDDLSLVAGTDNADAGLGAGFYNGDRIRQARALSEFAASVAEDKGIAPVFLTGDFNAYGAEDPVRRLEADGWQNLAPANGEASYSFGGLSGSLDHVFANAEAHAMVAGETIWPINANEPVYYEYSRYNYNAADLFDGTTPFRSSDHNPEIVGINAPTSPAPADVDTVQVLASNDFHGRLLDDPQGSAAGAAAMAGAVKQLRDENSDTIFAMAGDIVGASTFESFIQNDKPTIDAMNEAGLEVSAAGNHEFDQGYDDLMDRILSATHAEGGANWPYLAANLRLGTPDGDYALATERTDGHFANSNGATWWKDFPGLNDGQGIRVGFVGAVTEDLDSLVAPDAISGLAITDVVDEVNAAADQLKVDGCGGEPCDLVIELVHEGAASPACATIKNDSTSTFGQIVHGANDSVDAIVSGHTHLKYNCKVEVDGKPLHRPVVSAGQYGSFLNQLEFDFAPDTDDLVDIRQRVLALKDYDEDAATDAIVDAAVVVAEERGAVELGQVDGPFKRARRVDPQSGVVENRGGESTLGNLVAEIQRWKTDADIGVMNPGGLREDLIGTDDGPGPVTYREAANVQPFANTLVTTDLTGAQLKLLLEQQWQRDPDGNVPSRPFLRLGTSDGFTFTEDSSRPEGERITGMWLDGVAIDPDQSYAVSANSFVATGGDNFRAFTLGTNTQDTGFTDLQATVDYLAEFAATDPLAVDYAQHGVGARVPAGPFSAGDTVTIPLDSLSMTGGGSSVDITDITDTEVSVALGDTDLGTFPVTTALPTTPYDVPGAATVSFTLPAGLAGGATWLTVTGADTGTSAKVPVSVTDTRVDSTVSGTAADISLGQAGSVEVTVTPATATGRVELFDATTKLGQGDVTAGAATIAIAADALSVGSHTLTLRYLGDDATKPSEGTVDVKVVKATATVTATATPSSVVQDTGTSTVAVAVTATGVTPEGSVSAWLGGVELASADLVAGQAELVVGPFATAGSKSVEIRYSGSATVAADNETVTVMVTAKETPQPVVTTVTGTDVSMQWAKAGNVVATVSPSSASGTVELYAGTVKLGEAAVVSGTASIALPAKALEVGTHTLVLKYTGSATHAASQGTVGVTVTKTKPTVKVKKIKKVKAGKKAKIKTRVITEGYVATGKVRIVIKKIGAKKRIKVVRSLKGDKANVKVRIPRRGNYKVTVTYLGDAHTLRATKRVNLRVR